MLGRLLSDIEQLKDIQLSTSLRRSSKGLYLGNLEGRSPYSEGKTASFHSLYLNVEMRKNLVSLSFITTCAQFDVTGELCLIITLPINIS